MHTMVWNVIDRDENIAVVSGRCRVCGSSTPPGALDKTQPDAEAQLASLKLALMPTVPCR